LDFGRLSDFLFVGARFDANQENKKEVVYSARKGKTERNRNDK